MRELTDYDNYNGWIDAVDTVEVRARVRGHIQKIHFTDGQLVKKGDLLFELDPRTFESDIGRAKDQKAIAQAQLVAAQKEYARLKELLTRGGASQSQVDKAEADATALEATVKAEEQEIVRRQLELEYSKITAPLAGRIGRAMLSEGNLVNAGGSDPLLATIVSTDPIYIYFPVDERALQRYQKQRVREGQKNRPSTLKESQIKIRFGLETDEGYPYEATLDFADKTVDRTTGTIVARAVMPDPTGRLTPGSRVRIRVPTSAEHSVVLVSDTAILSDQDKKYVLVVDKKGAVAYREIKLGALHGNLRVIASGLSADERIVVNGVQRVRPGQTVRAHMVPMTDDPSSNGSASADAGQAGAAQSTNS